MGQLVLGVAGAIAGSFIPGVGPSVGWAVGSAVGGFLFAPKPKDQKQALMDLKVVGTEYGQSIPYVIGSQRVAGQVWWNSDRIPVKHKQKSSGGKGGGGGSSSTTTYTYKIDLLLGLTSHVIAGIRRIWIDGKMVWANGAGFAAGTIIASETSELWERLTVYTGESTQMPDPDYDTAITALGKPVPAYRGRGTAFIKGLELGSSGRIPNITFEVVADATGTEYVMNDYAWDAAMTTAPLYITECGVAYVSSTNEVWVIDSKHSPKARVCVFDLATDTWVAFIDFPDGQIVPGGTDGATTQWIRYVPEWDTVFVNCRGGSLDSNVAVYDVQSRTLTGTFYDLAAYAARYTYGAPLIMLDVPNKVAFTVANVYDYTMWSLDPVTYLPTAEIGREYINDNFQRLGVHPNIADKNGDFWYLGEAGTEDFVYYARNWQRFIRATGYNRVHIELDADAIRYSGGQSTHDVCYDPTRHCIYYWDATSTKLKKLDCDTYDISTIGTYGNGYQDPGGKRLFYDDMRDRIAAVGWASVSAGGINWINPDDGSIEEFVAIATVRMYSDDLDYVPGWGLYGSGTIASTNQLNELLFKNLTPVCVDIGDAVSRLCLRAGLSANQFDVTALSTITNQVCSFTISQVSPTREALERLAAVYFFYAWCRDKIYFAPRGGAAAFTLNYEDLGAGSPGENKLPLALGSGNDLEIPAQIAVVYVNIDNDYQTDTQPSDRLVSATDASAQETQLSVGMTPSVAKAVADSMLRDMVARALVTCTVDVMGLNTLAEPGDIVTLIDSDGSTFRMFNVETTDNYPLATLKLAHDDASALTSLGITSVDYSQSTSLAGAVGSLWLLLDIPMLQDDDDSAGFYVPAHGDAANWPGGSVFDSNDNVTYTAQSDIITSAVFGTCTTTLGSWSGGRVIDEISAVTVNVGDGTIDSSTRDAVLADGSVNLILIGNELVQAITATLVSPGVYTLTRLLRGCRGTEWAMTGHAASERCAVLANDGSVTRAALTNAQIGVSRYYKVVTFGRLETTETGEAFSCDAICLKPFSPIDMRGERDGSNNLSVTCQTRSRYAVRMIGTAGISVPLGEQSAAYELDVYSDGTYTTVLRTISGTLSGTLVSFSYSAANQTSDGLTPGNPVYCRAYQLSASIGRGYALEGVA